MPEGVYNADELVYTVLTEEERKNRKFRSTSIRSWIALIAVISLALAIVYWHYKVLTLGPESSPNGCPRRYEYFGKTGACYRITIPAVAFEEAKRSCEYDETHLVSIHSKEESDYLTGKYKEKVLEFQRKVGTNQERTSFWTGLSLENEKWLWSDGSEVDYENWKHEVPGNQSQAVVETASNDSWITVPRNSKQGFICKKQLRFSKKRRDLKKTLISLSNKLKTGSLKTKVEDILRKRAYPKV